MLEQVGDRLWLAEGPIVDFYSFPYPTRMVIARLGNNDLWVWSPVKLDAALKGKADALGRTAHLVSPNKIHHLYLPEWHAAYPEAKLWGPASTIARFPALPFEPPLEDSVPAAWQPDIDQAWFRGSIMMDEVVFFHRPSQTAILADLIEAFSADFLKTHWSWWQRPLAALDGITLSKPGPPREWRLSFTTRAPARAAREKVLGWPAERVVMAHGEWQRADGHAFLQRAFAWLGR
ncbi:hypothetical protein AUC68_06590 [Methyloceanibacter methanicus]|uniref:DUF4336 domain-containing protein n=1 Tax=Methyloceanibacter methanicus TaxID=1774968 RepID=A0A1E3W013_9HYPH|nr:DUF4336 domain-containing protein [Methyloceanibacter methanicus]ODR98851.1 hypothetical protein AUC68_06590 [Methyloceanibacter methanicus]